MTAPGRPCKAAARRGQRGQVIAIFAVVAVVLFTVAGLALDGGFAYLRSNATERAAAAAALAGVPYMPAGFGSTVDSAAKSAASRNGFTDGDNSGGRGVTVVVSRYPAGCSGSACADNKLTVTVSENVPTTFMHVIGVGTHRVSQSSTAQFLPPVGLGQPGTQIGPSKPADVGVTNNGAYLPWMEGWGVARENGDAYTPDPYQTAKNTSCEQVPSNWYRRADSSDVHNISALNGTEVSDIAMTGAGFSKLPTRGGYDYSVTVPTGTTGVRLQVFNPAFAPDGTTGPGSMNESLFFQIDSSYYTDQTRYSAMEYTVFKVNDQFNHANDTPITQLVFNPLNPYSQSGTVKDMRSNKTVTSVQAAGVYHAWTDLVGPVAPTIPGDTLAPAGVTVTKPVATGLGPGTYRLRVDALDFKALRPGDDVGANYCSQAGKSYSVGLVGSAGLQCSQGGSGCTTTMLSGLDELTVYTPIQNASFDMPLFYIPADYAGLTVNVWLYDLGDVQLANGASQATVEIHQPDNTVATTAAPIQDLGTSRTNPSEGKVNSCLTTTPQADETKASLVTQYSSPVYNSCDNQTSLDPSASSWRGPFNSSWLRFQISVPSTYTTPGYWTLHYTSGGQALDVFSVVAGFDGTAVHLLP